MLANFSEAIIEYKYSNITGSNQDISEDFFVELNMAWDVLFNSWLNSKDLKVICIFQFSNRELNVCYMAHMHPK